MSFNSHKHLGVISLSLLFVLNKQKSLSLPQSLLISPIVTHPKLLSYLSNKNVSVQSMEQVVISHPQWFLNFNHRFYDFSVPTINAIQFLHDLDLISFEDDNLHSFEEIEYNKKMGNTIKKVDNASLKIAKMISGKISSTYTNLRVQI